MSEQQGLEQLSAAGLPDIAERVGAYIAASKAASTRRAYATDWRDFTEWCAWKGVPALPAAPATVAAYLSALADGGKKASTINRRAAAIRFAHKVAGYDSPTSSALVEATTAGIRRQIGTAQQGKAPAVTEDVRRMIATLPDTLRGTRDRALLLVGFAGAFRRSELVGLDLDDVTFCPEGMVVTLRRSKTDQEGEGQRKGIPCGTSEDTCPVRALQRWLEASGAMGSEPGPLFRAVNRWGGLGERLSPIDVARAVKKAARAAGLDARRYSGHSLRAGLATAAAAAGVRERDIMRQ
ncbi:MAG: tyrosine-type recombinase/integrase, partial [Armatimonadota bacterium]